MGKPGRPRRIREGEEGHEPEDGGEESNVATLDAEEIVAGHPFAMLDPIIPQNQADQFRIIDRAMALAAIPEWRDQFTYIAHRGNTKLQFQYPGHQAKEIIPDQRVPDVRVPVKALMARFSYYSPDARVSDKFGIYCILDQPEVIQLGEYDPFYLKLLAEGPSNEAWRNRFIGVVEAREIFAAKIEAVEAQHRANQLLSASTGTRIEKTGRDRVLAELTQKNLAAQMQRATQPGV